MYATDMGILLLSIALGTLSDVIHTEYGLIPVIICLPSIHVYKTNWKADRTAEKGKFNVNFIVVYLSWAEHCVKGNVKRFCLM